MVDFAAPEILLAAIVASDVAGSDSVGVPRSFMYLNEPGVVVAMTVRHAGLTLQQWNVVAPSTGAIAGLSPNGLIIACVDVQRSDGMSVSGVGDSLNFITEVNCTIDWQSVSEGVLEGIPGEFVQAVTRISVGDQIAVGEMTAGGIANAQETNTAQSEGGVLIVGRPAVALALPYSFSSLGSEAASASSTAA